MEWRGGVNDKCGVMYVSLLEGECLGVISLRRFPWPDSRNELIGFFPPPLADRREGGANGGPEKS